MNKLYEQARVNVVCTLDKWTLMKARIQSDYIACILRFDSAMRTKS